MTSKTCPRCRQNLPIDGFYKNARLKGGVDTYCKPCINKSSAEHYAKNRERRNAQAREWAVRNPGKAAAYSKAWRDANPGAQQACERRWYEKNREVVLEKDRLDRIARRDKYLAREKESYLRNFAARQQRGRDWRAANASTVSAYAAERRAAKAQRTPPWLTDEQRALIATAYEIANLLTLATGVLHHVDHIVPLRGKTVSGLHVPWNLQCLTATENLSKSNKVVSL